LFKINFHFSTLRKKEEFWMKTVSTLALAFTAGLLSNPEGFSLQSGEASCALNENTLTIHTSDRAVIHWDSFSIASHETTHFNMPSSSSAVLNRVVGGNLSEIYGTLESNGKVYLLNPKGILFGEKAVINTASFFASTLDVLDDSFLKNTDLTFFGSSTATIVNLGELSAKEGSITLVAYRVENQGSLLAPQGDVFVSGGSNFLIQPGEASKALIHATFPEGGGSIDQQGRIEALRIELNASGNPHELAIRGGGSIDALMVQEEGGKIFLVAEEGSIASGGTLHAESGTVVVLAKEIRLEEESSIDVSGKTGGHIAIGDSHFCEHTYVQPRASLRADSLTEGDGGTILLWSREGTAFFGTISAEGGPQGGSGGFVEISSHGSLVAQGVVSTLAPLGKIGQLLFDPCQVTISAGADANISTTPPPDYTFGAAATANINNAALGVFLATNNVTINATTGGGTTAPGTEFIHVDAPVTWAPAAPTALTLITTTAGSEIQINDSIYMTQPGFTAASTVISVQSPQVTIGSAASVTDCQLRASSGSIQIAPGSGALSMLGGSGANAAGQIIIDSTGNIDIQLSGPMIMTGGSGTNSRASIQGNNSAVTIVADSLTMTGGTSASGGGSDAVISSTTQVMSITTTGDTTLQASSTPSQNARMNNTSNNIQINCANLNILGALAPTGTNAFSEIALTGNGSINVIATGAVNITGGQSINSSSSINSDGGVSIQMAGGVFVTGTTNPAANGAGARISSEDSLTIEGSGPITLQGGASDTARAEVFCTDGPITVGNITPPSMVNLTGGTGNDSYAQITTLDPTGTITMTITGDYNLTGGTGTGGTYASIYSDAAPITLQGVNMRLEGVSSQGVAQVQTGAGNISVTLTNDIQFIGGPQANSVANLSTLVSGNINIDCNDFLGSGGTGNNAHAGVVTQSGDIFINCSGDFTLQGNGAGPSLGEIQTFGSNLTIQADLSVFLSDNTLLSVPAPTGDLLVIAGIDMNIDAAAQIIANGTGSITLVVDNQFPLAPGIGPGVFNFQNGTIQAVGGGPLRIFTATQPQNTILGSLNGQPYVAGIEFVNTNQERWGTYYFDAFFGGPGYTIFYKDGTTPVVITPTLTQTLIAAVVESAFLGSDLFFDLDAYDDDYFFDDFFAWSDFHIDYNRAAFKKSKRFELIEDKGLSIRQRKGYNKITPTRGL